MKRKVELVQDSATGLETSNGINVAEVTGAVVDNAIVRFDGTSGQVQNSSVVIDDSGNVGIGVTPSPWTNYKAIEIGAVGNAILGISNSTVTTNNAYWQSGSWKYATTGAANRFEVGAGSGKFQWFTAQSGTAGSAITWTTAMTLQSNGNLLVGTTTDNGVDKLQVNGSMSISNLTGSSTSFYQSGTSTAYISDGTNSVQVGEWIWSRVGKTVTASINQLDLPSTISGFSSGHLTISGLPFALNGRAVGGIGGSPYGVFTGVDRLLFAGDYGMFGIFLISSYPTNNTYFHLKKSNIAITSGTLCYGASITYNAII